MVSKTLSGFKRRKLGIWNEPPGNGETDWSAMRSDSGVIKLRQKVKTGIKNVIENLVILKQIMKDTHSKNKNNV